MLRFAAMTSALALATLPLAAAAQVQPMIQVEGDAPIVTLNITETIDAKPDTATIGAGVQTTAPTATDALRQNSVKMDALIKAVKARGVADKDIQTTGINLSPQYDYNPQQRGLPPRFTGYQVSNEVRVKTREISKLGEMLDALISAGGNQINGPYFSLDNDDALKVQARTRALQTAQEQARFYAQQTGYSNVRLVGITESQGYARPYNQIMVTGAAMRDSAEAKAPVEPGQVGTTVNIAVQYQLMR